MRIRMVPRPVDVGLKSWSLWANRAGFASLLVPAALWRWWGLETDPYLWGKIGLALYVLAELLRYIDQGGIDGKRDTFFSRAWVGAVALVMVLGAGLVSVGDPVQSIRAAPAPVVEVEAPALPVQRSAEAAFLNHALPLVAKWEGLRLTAYLDPVGVLTVCYGETQGVRPGDTYSEADCAAMLSRRLLEYRAGLHRYLTAETRARRLPPTRDAAFGSMAYNVGIAGAGGSTAVKRLNAGNVPGACEAMTWWNKAGGKVLRGLTRRREDERALCMVGAT
ncbi:lysozyme [Ponticoccus alexandrii]|nr:lysozyme [Ponticoccus alexandrii]